MRKQEESGEATSLMVGGGGGEPVLPTTDSGDGLPRAVIYLRVSTKEQAEMGGEAEGYSIPAQREACYRKAPSLGAMIEREFVDRGESARSVDRPELQAMLAYVKEHRIDYVIVHKVDRLARSRLDDVTINVELQAAGAKLVSVTENIDETPSGLLLHGIMSSIAEFYSRNLANEVLKGSTQKAKLGGTIGKAPTGYLNVRRMEHGREVRTVEIDPVRGPLMAWAFEAYATGEWTTRGLLAEVTKRGLTSVPGPRTTAKPLVLSNLQRLLKHPYYKGVVCYRGAWYPGQHDPLVSNDTWNRVQEVLAAKNYVGEKQREHPHYLKGSVFCGQCGSRLIVSFAKNRFSSVYPYFVCIGRHQKRTDCSQQALRIEAVEALVERVYGQIQLEPERIAAIRDFVREGLGQQQASLEVERRTQAQRLMKATEERDKLLQAFYAGAISLELLKREQTRLTKELEDAQAALKAAQQEFGEIEQTLETALTLAGDCQAMYRAATEKVRRQCNQAFFTELLIDDQGEVQVELAEPFALLLGEDLARVLAGHLAEGIEGKTNQGVAPWRAEGFWENDKTLPGQGLKERLLVGRQGLEPCPPDKSLPHAVLSRPLHVVWCRCVRVVTASPAVP